MLSMLDGIFEKFKSGLDEKTEETNKILLEILDELRKLNEKND